MTGSGKPVLPTELDIKLFPAEHQVAGSLECVYLAGLLRSRSGRQRGSVGLRGIGLRRVVFGASAVLPERAGSGTGCRSCTSSVKTASDPLGKCPCEHPEPQRSHSGNRSHSATASLLAASGLRAARGSRVQQAGFAQRPVPATAITAEHAATKGDAQQHRSKHNRAFSSRINSSIIKVQPKGHSIVSAPASKTLEHASFFSKKFNAPARRRFPDAKESESLPDIRPPFVSQCAMLPEPAGGSRWP